MSKSLTNKAFVTTAMCSRSKQLFGITVDELCRGQYTFVWSFKLNEKRAQNEGFDKHSVKGGISFENDFPGCPYCGAKNFVFCGKCGSISCYHGEGTTTCLKCGYTSRVETTESFDIKGGSL